MVRVMSRSYGLALSALVLFAACTPTSNSSSTSVKIVLPDFNEKKTSASEAKASAKAGDVQAFSNVRALDRVMINVRGPGIGSPLILIWQAKNDETRLQTQPPPPPPPLPPLDVPRGTGRLVQVLAITRDLIYNDSQTQLLAQGKQNFYYGDVVSDFNQANADLELTVSAINFGIASSDGAIAGRYISGVGADGKDFGPTGIINVNFAPPNGAPPMTVTQSEMHGGWFEVIAFEGTPFSYVLESGLDLMGGIFKIGKTPMTLSGERALVRVPTRYKEFGGGYRSLQDPSLALLGYFGPGSAGHVMCYPKTSTDSIPYAYVSAASGDNTTLKWDGTAAYPASANSAGVIGGGQAHTSNACGTAANYWSTWMALATNRLNEMHSTLQFQGPFYAFTASGQSYPTYVNAVAQNNVLGLEWRYLPGTTGSSRVMGVDIFARTFANPPSSYGGQRDYEIDGLIACDRLTDAGFLTNVFTKVATVPVQASSAQTFTIADAALSNKFKSNLAELVLCPYSDSIGGKHFRGAVSVGFGGDSGGSSSPMADRKLKISGPMNLSANSTCGAYTATYYENGSPTAVQAAMALNLSTTAASGSGQFYSDSGCSTSITSISIAAASSQSSTFYYKDTARGMPDLKVMDTAATNQAWGENFTVTVGDTYTPSKTLLSFVGNVSMSPGGGSAALAQGVCYGLRMTLQDSGNMPASSSATSVTLSDSSSGSFWSDAGCATTQISGGTVAFAASEYTKIIYFKPTSGTGAKAISASLSGILNYDLAAATVANYAIRLQNGSNGSWFAPGTCSPAQVTPLASNGAYLTAPSAVSVDLSTPDSSLVYSRYGDCSTASSTFSTSLSAGGSSSSMFYVKPVSGFSTVKGTASVSGSPYQTVYYQQPDEIFFASAPDYNSSSAKYKLMANYCQKVSLEARWSGAAKASSPADLYFNYNNRSGSSLQFYSDSTCATSLSPSASNKITAGSPTTMQLYVRGSTGGGVDFDVPGTTLSKVSLLFESATPPSIAIAHDLTTISSYSCVAITPQLGSAAPADIAIELTLQSTLNLAASGGNYFYSDASCTTAIAGNTISDTILKGTTQLTTPIRAYIKFGSISPSQIPTVRMTAPQFPASYVDSSPSSCVSTCSWP